MQNIFTYGSLMFDPVWSRVVGGEYPSCPATLHGYQRFAVKGEEYPVAIPSSPESSIYGRLYLDVNPQDVQKLDDFEGEYYIRLRAPVICNTEEMLDADVYVLRPQYQHVASHTAWDVEHFRRVGIKAFMSRYQGFV
ncbi:MAG: gamma-glutamylcyclotransferase [Gammaproteobacteria bacterium]|nr:gamma-glutamylcyclotransferase [Gammaproteobacteria bacterium]MBU1724428.1 gamma-glutamylcyclotransferase [Gammaproteobacteria bacterium]MBU2004353.1 gamma-glutamylcyclotransferase [Gammaproteobacteria bacterium]